MTRIDYFTGTCQEPDLITFFMHDKEQKVLFLKSEISPALQSYQPYIYNSFFCGVHRLIESLGKLISYIGNEKTTAQEWASAFKNLGRSLVELTIIGGIPLMIYDYYNCSRAERELNIGFTSNRLWLPVWSDSFSGHWCGLGYPEIGVIADGKYVASLSLKQFTVANPLCKNSEEIFGQFIHHCHEIKKQWSLPEPLDVSYLSYLQGRLNGYFNEKIIEIASETEWDEDLFKKIIDTSAFNLPSENYCEAMRLGVWLHDDFPGLVYDREEIIKNYINDALRRVQSQSQNEQD